MLRKIVSERIGLLLAVLILASVSGGLYFYRNANRSANENVIQQTLDELSPEVEKVVGKKLSLIENLATNDVIVSETLSQSIKNATLTTKQIEKLDEDWLTNRGGFVDGYLTNKVAFELLEFQELNPGFPEIFVTDSKGLNVGQTNKTSDYYQADEKWWIDAYADGVGKSYHGDIEYDESAQSESVSLYVPVIGSEGKVVGIIKAVMDIRAIEREL
ncbi:MAG TPA: hypothetical protein VI819_03290 [Patescibacteria group bacterium]|nr:hypothetical protein [Patescibacteria group bacterium]